MTRSRPSSAARGAGRSVSGSAPRRLTCSFRTEDRHQLGETACFCPSEACPVAYFDAFERLVTLNQLIKPVYPKDPDAPICCCFGLTREEIEEDVREGVATRTRALIERSKSPEARCPQMAANGQSCVPAVQRYFMKCRQR